MNGKLKRTTKILLAVFVVGLSLLLYPTVSNYINSKNSTRAINSYIADMEGIDSDRYKGIWEEAVAYNADLSERDNSYSLTPELEERYYSALDITGSGVMGYIEIPKLDVSFPIYHGTSESVLQHAVGHIEWSSLPTGGAGTHCVVSGHRGLPSVKLFTDLDKLRDGDTFSLIVLDVVLTYEVDQIRTVEPRDAEELLIDPNEDYCTLLTCTPYGINTHRLLVRGHRVEAVRVDNIHIVSEAVVIDPLIVAPIVAFPLLFTLVLMVMLKKPEVKKKSDKNRL